MIDYFSHKITYKSVSFCYSKTPIIDEREIHRYHEILYYVGGDATFICDDFSQKLAPNSLLLIPREHYHFLKLEDPTSFERIKIGFSHVDGFEELVRSNMTQIRIIESPNDSTRFALESIRLKLTEQEDGVQCSAFLFASLLMILSSIELSNPKSHEFSRNKLISGVLSYVHDNLSSGLSADDIAQVMNVSTSTLTHTFKREMGISLHKYVTQKRLSLADRMINEGAPPTKIFTDCGFGDYSSFYKAYLKHFGRSPGSTENFH